MTAAEALAPRRAGGDAGHVHGCARDHALIEACAAPIDTVAAPASSPRVVPCVAAIVTNASGHLLLVRTKRGWELPGGRLEHGETWRQAIRRELREETGLDVMLENSEPTIFDGMPVNGAQYQSIILICRGYVSDGAVPAPERGDAVREARLFARYDVDISGLSHIATSRIVREWVGDDAHEIALRRVEDARAALPEMLRRGYALDEGQVATVLRVADALAAGVSLEAREALGREVVAVFHEGGPVARWAPEIGARLFALGRASVTPPDADMARVIAAWRWLCAWDRDTLRLNAERYARAGIREVVDRLFAEGDERASVSVMLEFAPPPGVSVAGCDVDGLPATAEQWAKLRAAGVPVAESVGLP